MDEELKVGPHLLYVLLALVSHNVLEQNHEPTGHTRQRSHVLMHCLGRYLLQLIFPFGNESHIFGWGFEPVAPEGGIANHDGREVARLAQAIAQGANLLAATQSEA